MKDHKGKGIGCRAVIETASGYDLKQKNVKSLNLSDEYRPRPSASQAAISASVTTTKQVCVAANLSKWQKFVKENGGKSVESTNGVRYTGCDNRGNKALT